MRPKPSWHAEARALADQGLSPGEICRAVGKTYSAVYRALNPEKAREYAARDNARPERAAAKRLDEQRRKAEWRTRHQDADPGIPGLIPLWDAHKCITGFTRVDIADWGWLREHSFSQVGSGYATTRVGNERVYLHHLLVGHVKRGSGVHTDHINRDKLDNRRANLRVVTAQENQHNRGGMHERCWWRQQQAA